jgi:hypothetical protein
MKRKGETAAQMSVRKGVKKTELINIVQDEKHEYNMYLRVNC